MSFARSLNDKAPALDATSIFAQAINFFRTTTITWIMGDKSNRTDLEVDTFLQPGHVTRNLALVSRKNYCRIQNTPQPFLHITSLLCSLGLQPYDLTRSDAATEFIWRNDVQWQMDGWLWTVCTNRSTVAASITATRSGRMPRLAFVTEAVFSVKYALRLKKYFSIEHDRS